MNSNYNRIVAKTSRWSCLIFSIVLTVSACEKHAPVEEHAAPAQSNIVEPPPATVVEAIQKEFPGAVPYKQGIDSLLGKLNAFGIPSNSLLWGQSTCVDDIINTKDKLASDIKGPFNFGGLAGLPFTGIAGLDAFAHHVPEYGTALLFVGPHIGYTEKDGWGKILRHDQHQPSSCCGALVGALTKLKKGELKLEAPGKDDFQEQTLEQLAFANRDKIMSSPEPLVTLTQITYHEAIKEISVFAGRVRERHFKYAVVVGAVIINTDFNLTDYVWIEHISILDVRKNEWVLGGKPMAYDKQ